MSENDLSLEDAVRRQANTTVTQTPADPDALSPEAIQQALRELQLRQTEIEKQNEELRQMRAELEASRARYFDLYNLAPVGYATLNDSGVILEANLTFASLLGQTREALVNQPLIQFVLPAHQPIYHQHREQLLATGARQNCEVQMIRADGDPCWVQIEGIVIPNDQGTPICRVVISDISKRKQTEQALVESEEMFSQFLQHSPTYVFFKDKDTRAIRLSQNYENLLGKPIKDVIGKNAYELFPPDLARSMTADDLRVLHEGKQVETEEEFNGRYYATVKFPIYHEGEARYLAGYTTDITEHKLAAKAAQTSEKRLKEAEAIAHFGYYEIDIPTGEAVWSDETFRIFGLDPANGPPTVDQYQALIHPEDVAKLYQMFAASIENQQSFDLVYRIRYSSGELRYVHSIGSVEINATGSVKMFGTLHDITEHKRNEIALQHSENRFRALIEHAPDAINLISVDGRLSYASPSALRILGYTTADIMDANMAELTHPDDLTAVVALLMEIIQQPGKVITTQYRFRHKDQSWRYLESTISNLLAEPGIEAILFNFRDITQQKQAEESARQQSEQIHLLYNASQRLNRTLDLEEIYQTIYGFLSAILPCDSLLISAYDSMTQLITCRAYWAGQGERLDVSSLPPLPLEPEGYGTQSQVIRTGRPLLLNDYLTQRKTTQPAYFINDETSEILHQEELPPDADVTRSALIAPLKMDEQVSGVIQIMSYHRDAYTENHLKLLEALALHINSAQANALLYAQVQNELNERKQAEAALRESAAKLRLLFEILPVGVSILNAERQLVYVNPALSEILEIPPEGLLYGDYRQRNYIGADGAPMMPQNFASARATSEQQTIQHVETGIRKEDGRIIWTDVSAVPVSFPDWKVVVVTTNITERKQAEEALRESHRRLEEAMDELRQAQAQLVQQERLAAVGQLAAGIAHDFNNILAIITLYVEISQRNPDLSPELHKRLDIIGHQSERAAHLVQQILDFGRRAILQSHSLDLTAFLREQVELWQRTIPESIKIILNGEGIGCIIHADSTRIQQMLTNLILNARDAMPYGGDLRLGLEPFSLGSQPENHMLPPLPDMTAGDWVRITVSDTGTGIPPAALPHIFEPFFTTKEPGRGSGLGLAQVYGIVKQHRGHIAVQTDEGLGTTFTIYLPALPMTPLQTTAVDKTSLLQGSGETILIVEDNDTLRETLTSALTMLNYATLAAANGREALLILERQRTTGQEVALVLSDLIMPEMGGKELFYALRQQGLTLPVVILSGHPMETELQALQSQGLAGWLLKPYDLQKLAATLARALYKGRDVR